MADPGDREQRRSGLAVATVGITLVVSMAVGFWMGSWLDGRLGTYPWLTIVFFLFGLAAGFRELYRTARKHWPRD